MRGEHGVFKPAGGMRAVNAKSANLPHHVSTRHHRSAIFAMHIPKKLYHLVMELAVFVGC